MTLPDHCRRGEEALRKLGLCPELIHALRRAEADLPFPESGEEAEADAFLRSVKGIQLSRLERALDAPGLLKLENLTSIAVAFAPLVSAEKLLHFKKLKQIWLCCTGLRDFSFLRAFPDLEGLDLSDNPIEDYSFFEALPELRFLSLANQELTEERLGFLHALKKIKNLNLDDNRIQSLATFPELPELEVLSLDGNGLRSLEGLRAPRLETLFVSENELADLSPLCGLSELNLIVANQNRIPSVRDLEDLPKLETLELRDNPLTCFEIDESLLDAEIILSDDLEIPDPAEPPHPKQKPQSQKENK